MRSEDSWQDGTSLNVSRERYRKVLTEYYSLVKQPELNEPEALRVYEILQLAEDDSLLSFLLNEIDEITYQELGLNNEENQSYLADEAAKVEEMLPDEFSEKALRQFVTANRYYPADAPGQSYYSIPRVEMAFDSSHIARVKFERSYSQDEILFLCPRCGESHFRINSNGEYKCLLCKSRTSIRTFLKEESVSIFTYLSLLVLVCLVFLV